MNSLNKRRFKKIVYILIICGIFSLLAITFDVLMMFTQSQYTAFTYSVFMWISLGGIMTTLCLFFLYSSSIVFFFNPQKLKSSIRIGWGFAGLIALILFIVTITLTTRTTIASINDINDYNNKNWQIENVMIEKVYWGGERTNGLITTNIGEFTLPVRSTRLVVGQEYRITYLKHTNTIIFVE